MDLAGPYPLYPFGSFVSVDVGRLLHPITCDGLKPRHVLHLPALSTNYRFAEAAATIRRLLPTDDYVALSSRCSTFEERRLVEDTQTLYLVLY